MKRSVVAISMVLAGVAVAQEPDWSKVEVKVVPVAGGVSMLVGQGGNIGVTSGKDGIFLIDDQFEPLLPKIRAAVKTLGDGPIRFVVNTHFHGDHTGSNAKLYESGAVIIAQENVRKRLGMERINPNTKERTPPKPPEAWPLVTYASGVNLYLNGDELEVIHMARAHTDGDSVIRFKKANVVHMGDTFFNGNYPFIDLDAGGSIDGIIAAKPSAQFDATWGKGFMGPDLFVSFVHRSLTEKPVGTK